MSSKNRRLGLTLFVSVIMLGLPAHSQALVIAQAAMTVDDLRFSSSDPLAELFWLDVWRGDVFAQAQDTLSGTDAEAAEVFGDNAGVAVDASTALVESVAEYEVVNGPEVAKGAGDIEIITGTGLGIDGIEAQASGEAVGTFDNFFAVTGGNPGDPVDVTFELDYTYLLDAVADSFGFYEVFVFALLSIDDLDDTPGDVDNVDDFVDDFVLDFDAGSAKSIFKLVSDTLVVNATLEYGKEYFLFAEADSEVFGTNEVPVPEPGTLLLYLSGLGFLVYRYRIAARIKGVKI